MSGQLPTTPDGRYVVVRGRLWRCSNPNLFADERKLLVSDLMRARRQVGAALKRGDTSAIRTARRNVDEAKVALGERGPLWWNDGAPDYNQKMVANTPYRDWFAAVSAR